MTKDTGKADLKERFIELRAAGLSYADAAEQLNVSKPTLIAWSKELSCQIANARNIRIFFTGFVTVFRGGRGRNVWTFTSRPSRLATHKFSRNSNPML